MATVLRKEIARKAATALVFLCVCLCVHAAELPANTWAELSQGGIGPKFSPGMVYAPKLGRFVLIGGAIGRYPKGGPFPYDVLSAEPGGGKWRNEFPKDTDWQPELGPAKVPPWKSWRFSTKDVKGNVRPHMRHTRMYYQYCLDTDRNCVWAIIADHTMRLDLATMKWEDLGAKGTPRGLKWASMCYDPVNKEVILFGGAHRNPQPQGQTWLFSTGTREWRKLEAEQKPWDPLRKKVDSVRVQTRHFVASVRNRLHHTETTERSDADLVSAAKSLHKECDVLVTRMIAPIKTLVRPPKNPDRFKPLEQALDDVRRAAQALSAGRKQLTSGRRLDALAAWSRADAFLRKADHWLSASPAPRLMAPMCYVPNRKKIVMFGGDRWDHLCNETWVYDCEARRWERKLPAVNPPPRAGHALVGLAENGQVLLLGGYTYRTSMAYLTSLYKPAAFDMWTYDVEANEWRPMKYTGKPPRVSCIGRSPVAVAAAVSEGDVVQVVGLGKTLSTWAIQIEPTADASTKTEEPAGPEATVRRGLCFDPGWFDKTLKDAKPEAAAAKLEELPPNKWVAMQPPKRLFNRDWGTQVFDPDRDQILHWSGGHSAYCGTAPAHYSVKLNRWSIGFAPEIPMEHCYSAGVGGTRPACTFTGRPFAPHTYKSYCYHPQSKKLVWLHESKVWVYDPDRREWETERKRTPFYAERHTTVACPTPHGIAAWAVPAGKGVYHGWRGLWLLTDLEENTWKTLVEPSKKQLFPVAYGDRHGMCYDSKRDKLYLFHFGRKPKHQICVYDFGAGKAELIEPKGGEGFPSSASMGREPVYVPGQDVVFLASRVKDKSPVTLLYDPAKNAWLRMRPNFDKGKKGRPIRPAHGVSCGVMWDPNRKLLWASSSRGHIYVMKFDRATAKVQEIE
ncbi:MAG: kelch repeat-containing protein [Planctomycetota bacterium]